MKYWICSLMLLLPACSSTAPETKPGATEVVETELVEEETREFVVVDLMTPLYLAPNAESAFIRYRSVEEQTEVEGRLKEKAIERVKSLQERFEKEIEREKKRMKRMKDAEKRDEYAIARRERRARRFLNFQRKRARRSRELPPESRFVVLEKISEQPGWIEVRTLSDREEARHCYSGALGPLGSMHLNFWVRSDAPRELVRRRERVGIWRGTEVKLAPGVVIEEVDGDKYALVDGYRIRVDGIDEDAISTAYPSPSLFQTPVTDTQFTDVSLAEGLLRLNRSDFLPYNPYQNLYVTATMWVGSRFYATTRTPCGEYTILTAEEELRPAGRREALRIAGEPPMADPPLIRKDSTVFLRDGTRLGIVTRDLALPDDADEVDGRICSTTWVWKKRRKKKDETRRLKWCVEASAVERER